MTSVSRLDNFGFLSVTGKDARKFLQGYVTCDMEDVTDTHSSVGAICNLQGRMVTSFRIAAVDEGYLLRMDKALVPATMEFLKKYIVFSKAHMQDLSGSWYCFGVAGDVAGFPATRREVARPGDGCAIRVADDAHFEFWTAQPDWRPADAETLPVAAWRTWEIAAGYAWVVPQTTAEFIPQMFNYHEIGGVDFDKGCYLGQEIVARMQYRGALSRKLFRGTAARPHSVGDSLQDEQGKTVGQVVAAEGESFLAVLQVKDELVPEVPGCEFQPAATLGRTAR